MSRKNLLFHIKVDDYFGTLATVLDLLRQDLAEGHVLDPERTLARMRDDLMYLQAHFMIVAKGSHSRHPHHGKVA